MTECLFCRIIADTSPATRVYEDDDLVVIDDIQPQAPFHVLVLPRRHIATLNDVQPDDDRLIGSMMRRAASLAKARGFADSGYRTVFNCNRDAQQSVFHIHLHVLGGRSFKWPPG